MQTTDQLRPTSDKVRETLFNWLMQDIVQARCLDLFSGTGILGIEALSRGAEYVDFVEQDKNLCEQISHILHALQVPSRATVWCEKAQSWLARPKNSEHYDIVFLDPPYRLDIYPILEALVTSGILAPETKVYIEQGTPLNIDKLPADWSLLKNNKSGQIHYYLISCRR